MRFLFLCNLFPIFELFSICIGAERPHCTWHVLSLSKVNLLVQAVKTGKTAVVDVIVERLQEKGRAHQIKELLMTKVSPSITDILPVTDM